MKNMEPSSSLKILYPTAFHFKKERVLASHPPSFHPWRVFGFPESGEKMRESGGKRKEAGTVERFPPILLMSKSSLCLQCIGAYILP